MASGALPPGFPAVEIEGEHYWDGGLVSNTPLEWVAQSEPRRDTRPSRSTSGALAASSPAISPRSRCGRRKSSTPAERAPIPITSSANNARAARLASLLEKLPPELRDSPEAQQLGALAETGQVIPVRFRGRIGGYTRCMFLNDHPPIAGGRELWGFPKKLASPSLRAEPTRWLGRWTTGRCGSRPPPWAISTARPTTTRCSLPSPPPTSC